MAKTSPADLTMDVRFSDRTGFFLNNILDAGETAEMIVSFKNKGKGTGFGTILNVTSNNSKMDFKKEIGIGDIQPGESKEVRVPVKAAFDIADGKAEFLLNVTERRRYDSNKVKLSVQTAKLESPKLEIVSTEIEDGTIGLAKGNGNHVIESGETIELIVFVRNGGVGPALGVNLTGADLTNGLAWLAGYDRALIGTLAPGETAKAKLAFSVPPNFDAKNISANLKVADMRPIDGAEYKFAQGYSKKSPDLQYAYHIFSKGKPVDAISNGGEYEVELTVSNNGQMAARNVVVNIEPASGAKVSWKRREIGDIKEKTAAQAHRFTLSVPRTFSAGQASVSITLSQAYFPSAQNTIQIPVHVKRPGLAYAANLISKNRGNTLEQREQAVFEVQVMNNGSLAADGVKVSLTSGDEDLQILGQKEVLVGTIPPDSSADIVRFQVSAKPRLLAGEARLGVNITQSDFAPLNRNYALNILEEAATIIDVAGEGRITGPALAVSSQAGPMIALKGVDSSTTAAAIDEDTYRLAFEVADLRNVAKITVLVNGKAVALKDATNMLGKAVKSKQIVQDIPLDEGENRIIITAYNADNTPSRKEFTVTRAVEEDVDTPTLIGKSNDKAVAVVIGISKFKYKIPPVAYARNDAETMAKYLYTTMGFKEKNIYTYYDEQADATALRKLFFSTLRTKIKPGVSAVFVFYSGHGTPDTNTQEPYFVPYDFDPAAPATTGLAANELYKQLAGLGAKSVTIVLDSCFSGMTSEGKTVIEGLSAGLLRSKDPFFNMKNGVLLSAATKEQPASWYDKKQHGLFTYFFLQGLHRAAADFDSNGMITMEEIARYVQMRVPEQAVALYNREQMPEVKGDATAVVVKYK